MYFVVQLVNPKTNFIAPKQWIEGIDEHWEKFVNHSLNRNQQFKCYYSDNPEAMDNENRPNGNFAPNFAADSSAGFPNEGCYRVKLLAYKGIT